MAEKIDVGMVLVRDKSSETMHPMLLMSLARTVVFPDGETLADKWDAQAKDVNKATHRTEITKSGINTFLWEINRFGNSNVVLNAHIAMGVATQPGNNTYEYKITLPTKFKPDGKTLDYQSATVTVTERNSSIFVKKKSIHTLHVKQEVGEISILVEHFKPVDGVNFDNEPYIMGDFNISIHYSFE